MIGNDIVDLKLSKKESNWKRKGYLDKVFTKREQLLISCSKNQDIAVWDLWSRKEAAYKIYNRQTKLRSYIPLEIHCFDLYSIDGVIFGEVECKGNTYYTKTEITSEKIHTIAVTNTSDFNKIQYFSAPIVILKVDGIPYLKNNSQQKPLSISHHGRFESIVSLL